MKKFRVILSLVCCLFLAGTSQAQQSYHNPVIDNSLPDPSVVRGQDGYFYLVATEDIHNVPVYCSHNLVDWRPVGTAFTDATRPRFLTDGAVWAPDISYIDGRYVMYYSLSKWGEGSANGIGVATADRPEGPYTDLGKLFTSSEIGVTNSIDPFYYADNGQNYLFWGSFNGIYCIELSADGLSIKEGASKKKVINNTVEASSIVKHGDYYYFIGSAGTCCEGANSTYKLVVARSTSLTSGYKNKNGKDVQSDGVLGSLGRNNLTDMLTGDGSTVIGPGHCSEMIEDNNGNTWLLHHGFTADDVDGGRKVFLSQVKWGSDGWPYIEGGHTAVTAQAPALAAIHEIGTAQELVAFAQMVNNGNGHVDAVLTADIDMTGITDFPGIGNDGNNHKRYHATFDGQGHRIKNLKMQGNDIALFPVTSDNTVIRNLIIDASCSFKGNGRVAAFISACNWDEWGSRKVEFYNCGNEATVEGTGANCAGLLGCNYDGDIAIIMKNCFNTGHIKGGWESAALSGWIGQNGNNRIDHCYNTAEVEGLDNNNQNNLFRGSVGAWKSPNNYCFDTHYSHNTGSVLDASKVASGELCVLLNEGQAESQWFQTLGTDLHPVPLSTSLPVYRNGNYYCDGTSKGSESFSNTPGSTYDPHQFSAADDLCNVCLSGREPQLSNGIYQIHSIGNLVWFADAVNNGAGTHYDAVLTADIVQGRAAYTPIGNAANAYQGHFDGQTHSVTLNLSNNTAYDYQGIFGIITDGVHIANLVARGTITGHSFVGGIAGGTNGGSNNATHTLLENCGNEATVTATGVNAGAMIGVNMNGSASFDFRNCYNTGRISGNESGAMSGWSGGGWSVFRNCYNAGKVNNGSDDFSRNNGTAYVNCYYLAGCNNNSRDEAAQLGPITAAQLANGELRNLLNADGTNWYQNNDDAYPLPFEHSYVVTSIGKNTVAPVAHPLSGGCYNLNGQRVQAGSRIKSGIYIQNGKKVIR
jgi:hypothetical protein